MLEHIRHVSTIASTLGANVLVFGAPKQRARGNLSEEVAFQLGAERFAVLAQVCAAEGVILAVEPVPAAYGGDFLPTWQDVKRMIQYVSSPNLAVHLDTACVVLGGGDIGDAVLSTATYVRHFHVSEPQLANFTDTKCDHSRAAECLREIGYDGWFAIEILGRTENSLSEAMEAVSFVKRQYGNPPSD
jgi:sugar phosphate isomerase/epimerase